jgi:putative hydrolase of the HAD superfamily
LSGAPFKQIAFDLDDTLLDTTHLLIPKAARESCLAMIEAGLLGNLEICIKTREEFAQSPKRLDIFDSLVERFGVRPGADPQSVSNIGRKAFYHRDVDLGISLFSGAREALEKLRGHYQLHLVTAGHRPTQEAKIRILKIGEFFSSIYLIDPAKSEVKGQAFSTILKKSGDSPNQHLSIGNRLDTDIGEAKRLGWRTCWVQHGEHASFAPINDFEKPDYTIHSIKDLIATCQL